MRAKATILEELKTMLADVFKAKEAGVVHARLARAHGYVDGYMRALVELDVFSQEELLRIVADERTRLSGPALGEARVDGEGVAA